MRRVCFCLAMILAVLCFSAPAVHAETEMPEITYGVPLEINTEYQKHLYPYVVHGKAANWYLAKADIDEFGLEAMCEGLSGTMEALEADYADARDALSGYLTEEIPVIRICTDFCDHAAISREAGAYFNGRSNFIKVFHSWTMAKAALLHEYVHYLTFPCANTSIRFGFWAEGIAEYVSVFVCRNRMFRLASMEIPEEVRTEMQAAGVLDPVDGTADEILTYLVTAQLYLRGDAVGTSYYAVANETIERTEAIQQNPEPNQLSYFEAASMVAYLVETYGEDTVFSHWDSDPADFETIFGLGFPELYQAWAAWNTRQCEAAGIDIENLPSSPIPAS